MDRRRMLHVFNAARDVGNYDDVPVLPANVDPQIHLSRNVVAQPFFLICEKDTVLAQLSGEATLYLKDSPVNRFAMSTGDIVYVPAGTPHQIVPTGECVQVRYKPRKAGLEGVAWYCPGCDRELHRIEWDTVLVASQRAYLDACRAFDGDESLRRCTDCGAQHPRIELSAFATWSAVGEQLQAELVEN